MPIYRTFVLGLVVLLALTGDSWARSRRPAVSHLHINQAQQTKANAGQQTTNTEQHGTEQNPLVIRRIESQEEIAESARERADKAFNDEITIVLSALVALATLFQFFAMLAIIFTTRRQLRAYVFAEINEQDKPRFSEERIWIPLRGRNRGQTPAYRTSHWIGCEVLPFPLVDEPHPILTEPFSYLDIGPTGEFMLIAEITRPLTPTEKAGLIKESHRIYIFGEIRYRDAFALWRWWDRTRQNRYTRFRYMVAMIEGEPRGLMVCPEGNGAN